MKKWVILIVAIFAFAVLWKEFGRRGAIGVGPASGFVNELPKTSPLYEQQQEFIDKLNADPALRDRFADSGGTFGDLSLALSRGAQSLDGASLLKATKAMSAMIPRLPPHSCAQLMRQTGAPDPALARDMDAAMARLPKTHHRNLWDFYVRALQAEVQNAPIRPRNTQNEQYAMQHLASKFNGPFAERLQGVLNNPMAASDEDACWAVNTLTHTATQLDPQSAEALARIIWTGGG